MIDWGVHKHGAYLSINDTAPVFDEALPFVVDVETDEKDNFVGLGLTQDGKTVYYYSDLGTVSGLFHRKVNLIGHNLKFDAKLLVKWGCDVTAEKLFADTILMSYCHNTTKESHGLKELGKALGYEWPSYRELVGKGHGKQTLDKQPVELVANYCAMDVLVTHKLYQDLKRKMDLNAARIYSQIELPLMRILFEMELQGVLVDVEKLTALDRQFTGRLGVLHSDLTMLSGCEINPNSNKQVAQVLTGLGLSLPKTPKGSLKVDKFVLEQHQEIDFVKKLIEYNKLEKLVSTYTKGMIKRETLPKIYTTYNQITVSADGGYKGISTGRLSSSDPNLQQIPTRTEDGQLLRGIFVGRLGNVLIDADYSQIEYRILAHFTKEPILLEAFRNGKDVHEETGRVLGCGRDIGKTLNFASIYGAQASKIARTAKVTDQEAEEFLKRYWQRLPSVTAWIRRVKWEATRKKGIYTLMKRWIPIPGITSNNKYERWHWERAAVNYLVQGSAAEIMKMAMIAIRAKGYLPLLTVHDELLFECQEFDVVEQSALIKLVMESVVKLDVPIVADVGTGTTWMEAKG